MAKRMVTLDAYGGQRVVFPSKWLTATIKTDFKMTLKKFINEEYTYDDVEYLKCEAENSGVEIVTLSKWSEIRNTYFDEDNKCLYIDGYISADDNAEGKVIAKIFTSDETGKTKIDYVDEDAEFDYYAVRMIAEAVTAFEDGEYNNN